MSILRRRFVSRACAAARAGVGCLSWRRLRRGRPHWRRLRFGRFCCLHLHRGRIRSRRRLRLVRLLGRVLLLRRIRVEFLGRIRDALRCG